MPKTILATKLFIPPPPPRAVDRPRLSERLDEGLHRRLTLISAPAGFGKTTLLSGWVASRNRPTAWLSLDDGDSDPARFLAYVIAAVQRVAPEVGAGLHAALISPQPPSPESILTVLINELAVRPEELLLVLDDYHLINAKPIDDALTFLLEHLPPQVHVLMSTREDPPLPLAGLRARGHLNELRAADLRFTIAEAAAFLNQTIGLNLSADDVAALDSRTEGWIAGLQLAAISLQGSDDPAGFITSFSGSHRFVLDYLLEEVLKRQPELVLDFLRRTSILDRMCGSLCDAVVLDSAMSGQEMLEYLEQANLFIGPLDNERRWYRYHHLFGELLRQRLYHSAGHSSAAASAEISGLHLRASVWFEDHNLEIEAFHHAVAANDVERAVQLIRGKNIPLYVRGGLTPVLNWMESLPTAILDAQPRLWVEFATVLAVAGRFTRVEHTLQAAEAALQGLPTSDETQVLVARIADLRGLAALLAADPRQVETIISQSRHTLTHLQEIAAPGRATGYWKLGLAYQHQGDRVAARLAQAEAIASSEATGNTHITILATTSMGNIQELDGQLRQASTTYRRVLHLVGDPPGPIACEAYVGLARISYEWNDLDLAAEYGNLSVRLARQLEIFSFVSSELFLARLEVARGDTVAATAILDRTERDARERQFLSRIPEIAALQASIFMRHGELEAAARLIAPHDLPLSQARIHLARGKPAQALAVLEPFRQHVEAKGWTDERLRVLILQAIAHKAHGDHEMALQVLSDALAQGEEEGFVRAFVDEGAPMVELLSEANAAGIKTGYTRRLLDAFAGEGPAITSARETQPVRSSPTLIESLSRREIEVLRLVAEGLSNKEISERLFLSLATVKGHNRVIFRKLQVQRRTEAIARARELGLL
jgi:LuxR family transcriptional regulator, maltose regulon positive regulatory protein